MRLKITNQELAQDLREILERMNNGGRHWIKGRWRKEIKGEMCYCIVGSINVQTKSTTRQRYLIEEIIATMKKDEVASSFVYRWGADRHNIMSFNDADETKWRDVKRVLSRTIKRLER
jgi:hypothetical protein